MSATAVATIAIGARAIGVVPAPDEIPMLCHGVAQCVQQNTVGQNLEVPLVHRRT
ncbi:hypothetical protein C8E89_13314 [Mycolicibacterium moriokaense]|uniref:Uncharacterized protein n=1 Tax=Mycolicibacterium moriokaense TaxID=39691 RepID=A0A318H7C3_9MYCO|nr:hypothetical protein C8E89_13314 [Mycolicibacterium moriokaense]